MVTKKLKKLISAVCAASLMITAVPAFAESDASLEALWVSGPAVIDFDSDVYEYDLLVPYRQTSAGVWELVLPEVHAIPSDSQATITTENFGDYIEVCVESADETTTNTYTLNVVGIGDNLYLNGGLEGDLQMADGGGQSYNYSNKADGGIVDAVSGDKQWQIGNGEFSIADDEVAAGSASLRVDAYTSSTTWYGLLKTEGGTLTDGKTYTSTVTGKLSASATQNSYATYQRIQYDSSSPTEIMYYNSNGVSSPQTVTFTKQWQTFGTVFDTTGLGDKIVKNNFTQWSASHPSIVLDNFYVGELVVSDIAITDEEGNPVSKVNLPVEGQTQLQLSANMVNQHGHGGGLENEEITAWQLIGNPEGVSVSDTGLLTVDSSAQNGDIYVEAIMEPSYSGAVQAKAKGVATITICDVTESELSGIKINGKPLAGFDSKKTSYSVDLPYTDASEDGTIPMPVIDATPKSDSARVDIYYPDYVDEGTIEITVTSAEDITSTYYISMKIIGRNLLENGGFENGTEGWTSVSCTIEETTENPAEGSKALLISGTNASRNWYTDLTLEPNKAYITSAMGRLKGDGKYECTYYFPNFKGSEKHYNDDGTLKGNAKVELTGTWQKTIAVLKNGDDPWSFRARYTNWGTEPDMVVDAYYVAELLVSDITYDGGRRIRVPATADGEDWLNLSVTMLNQFGNTAGLEDETMEWTLKEDYPGVSISGDKLIVNGNAHVQTITVSGKFAPSFLSTQNIEIEVEIELAAPDGNTSIPRADNVLITGSVAEGEALQADYDYYHAFNEPEGESILQWYKGNSVKGPFKPIDGETGLTLEDIPAELADSYICFAVTPVTQDGVSGKTVYSNVLLKPVAPVAKNVTVTGVSAVGQVLTGDYVFEDENGDSEGDTTFHWEIADTANGDYEPIPDETTKQYEIREGDIRKFVRFAVTPKSTVEPVQGEVIYYSAPVPCADIPIVRDVKINKVSDGVYSVSYKYEHPLSVEEGQSLIEWTVDGTSAGNSTSVNISESSEHTIRVSVTPVAALPPYNGEAVTATKSIEGPKGTSAGTVKGPSGKNPSNLVPVPEKPTEEKDNTATKPAEDNETQKPSQERYWASDGIDFVLENKIMNTKEDGSFAGTEMVCRAEFVSYVMQVLGEQEAAYTGMFSDVPADACYAGNLQRAVDMGIISVDTAFYPMRAVSRQEVCKIIVLAMGIENTQGADLSVYKDKDSIGQWALGYVSQAVNAKILNGVAADEFLPMGNVTREQTAVILKRLFDSKIGGTVK